MKTLFVSMIALVALATPAHAGDDPETEESTGGAFSPNFENSPVTVVLCLTEDACPIRPPR